MCQLVGEEEGAFPYLHLSEEGSVDTCTHLLQISNFPRRYSFSRPLHNFQFCSRNALHCSNSLRLDSHRLQCGWRSLVPQLTSVIKNLHFRFSLPVWKPANNVWPLFLLCQLRITVFFSVSIIFRLWRNE